MSKKIFVLQLIFILLCGCNSKKSVTPVLNNISFTAAFNCDDSEFECNADLSDNVLTVKVTKPETIKDFTLIYKNGAVTAEYIGITYTPKSYNMPQTAFAQIFYDAVNKINSDGITAECVDENAVINNKINGYDFSMIISPTGFPISFTVESLGLKAVFSNVVVK